MERSQDFHSTKKLLRSRHKKMRDDMVSQEVKSKSQQIVEKLLQTQWYQDCTIIYGYYPLGNEVDCRPFLEEAFLAGKQVLLPRTESDVQMEFYQITSLSQVEEGRFHVMEPRMECPLVQETTGVVLMPGVVFDKQGNRCGYGKGYYDRYLRRYPKLTPIGIAYEHQIEEYIKTEDTDIPAELVVTESHIYIAQ